jgi:GTPase SAR1 family protein
VYDITDPQSFSNIETWRKHFVLKSQPEDPNNVPILVLGNKLDLELEGPRQISSEEGSSYCRNNGNMIFYETSAK